jgi:Membrane carboxypeptidase/penicillin-binding protein
VIDQLEQQYGANTVREGGLKVYTTIDPRLQRLALKAMRDVLPYSTDPAPRSSPSSRGPARSAR